MSETVIARTASRSVLGTLNDFSQMLKWQLWGVPEPNLTVESVRLSRTPVEPLGLGWPDQVTYRLLGREAPPHRRRGGEPV